jgi:hypothetical protein
MSQVVIPRWVAAKILEGSESRHHNGRELEALRELRLAMNRLNHPALPKPDTNIGRVLRSIGPNGSVYGVIAVKTGLTREQIRHALKALRNMCLLEPAGGDRIRLTAMAMGAVADERRNEE